MILDKEHQALRIIDKKEVNVRFLKVSSNLDNYNEFISKMIKKGFPLTQEEYDLLKEVFANLL